MSPPNLARREQLAPDGTMRAEAPKRALALIGPMHLGRVARITGVTQRALRFYEEQGLISCRRDRRNCRVYDAAALSEAQWIARLRQAGLSLAVIREVLGLRRRRPVDAEAMLIGKLQDRLDDLDRQRAATSREMAALAPSASDTIDTRLPGKR